MIIETGVKINLDSFLISFHLSFHCLDYWKGVQKINHSIINNNNGVIIIIFHLCYFLVYDLKKICSRRVRSCLSGILIICQVQKNLTYSGQF